MAVLDSSSTSLARVSSHGRGGLSYFAYALLFVLYAVVGRWMLSTVGEPRATAVAQPMLLSPLRSASEWCTRTHLASAVARLRCMRPRRASRRARRR